MSRDKLVDLANQIGKVLAGRRPSPRRHRRSSAKYWNPRMRAMVIGHLARGGQGLDPVVRNAVLLLQTTDWMN
jgi:formate dehydrogenase subunit delta